MLQVADRGPLFFKPGSGLVTTLAQATIAEDGSFEVTLPEVPEGAFATLDRDDPTVFGFGCDASGVTIEPTGARLLVASFSTGAGTLVRRLQQGSSTLFVEPEPDDYWVFHVYADRGAHRPGDGCRQVA